jgi:GNAT superfamily N-acetyltransferase
MPIMNYTVRPATSNDVPALNKLVNSAYRGESSKAGWTTEADMLGGQRIDEERLSELMTDPRQTILCLVDEADVITGAVCLERNDKTACWYLGMLTIKPTLQAAGLGRKLMQAAEEFAVRFGAKEMTLGVIQVRTELMAWYERRGYIKSGEIIDFPYGDTRFGEPKRDDLHFVMFKKSIC